MRCLPNILMAATYIINQRNCFKLTNAFKNKFKLICNFLEKSKDSTGWLKWLTSTTLCSGSLNFTEYWPYCQAVQLLAVAAPLSKALSLILNKDNVNVALSLNHAKYVTKPSIATSTNTLIALLYKMQCNKPMNFYSTAA